MAATSIYVPRGSSGGLLPLWQASPSSTSGTDLGSFQITPSVLGLRACEILLLLFKSRVSVSYSPLALSYASPTGLQSQMLWGLIFWCNTGLGSPVWGLDPSLLGENLCNCDCSPFCMSPTWGCGS